MPGCVHPAFARGRKVKRCRQTRKSTASLRGGNFLKNIAKPIGRFAKDNFVNAAGCMAGSAGSCDLLKKNISKAGESARSSLQKLGEKGIQKGISKGKKFVKGKAESALKKVKDKAQNVLQSNLLKDNLSPQELIKEMMLRNPKVLNLIANKIMNKKI